MNDKEEQQPIDAPDALQAEKCINLRCRSKRGLKLNKRELAYVTRMFNLYPAWYESTEKEVFNRTVPFGSDSQWE